MSISSETLHYFYTAPQKMFRLLSAMTLFCLHQYS